MPKCNSEAMSMHREEIALPCCSRSACGRLARSGGMAWLGRTGGAIEDHAHAAASQVPPTRCSPEQGRSAGRERMAVHARQLALEPHLGVLRRHRRSMLPRLEPARRSTVAHHDTRTAAMGPWVLSITNWYQPANISEDVSVCSLDLGKPRG